jgi:RNA polymerase subunit RPABC4/transcription elongation factor Spt4
VIAAALPPGIGGLDSSNAGLVVGVVAAVIYFTILYVAVAFWIVRDARRRSESWLFATFAALIGLGLPFLGALLYLIIRPPRTLDEERALQLEEQALAEEEIVETPTVRPCPKCGREIEQEFVICPYCRTQFARRCAACGRWLRLGWHVCPYCAEEVGLQTIARSGRAASS